MKYSSSIALAMLASTSLAQEHHLHRREADPALAYETIQTTFYVTAGQEPATSQAAPAPSTSEAAPAPTTSEAAYTPTTSEAAYTPPSSEAPSTSETPSSSPSSSVVTTSPESSPSSSSSAAAPSSTSGGGSGAGSAGALGVTYSPYSNNGGCKSSDEIAREVKQLSGFSNIRLSASDCDQVSAVYKAKASGQKLFLGVYDVGSIESELDAINDAINGDWSDVDTVSIGNELVNSGQASVEDVKGYVDQGRSKLESLGYNGPVVAVDTFIATINNPGLCDVGDYLAVNAHAYFDGNVESSDAGKWALQQLQRVSSACDNNKKVTIVESGWPSRGDSNGKANASPDDQSAAIKSLKGSVGDDCYLFTAFNDLWKNPGYLQVEQYWGLFGSSDE